MAKATGQRGFTCTCISRIITPALIYKAARVEVMIFLWCSSAKALVVEVKLTPFRICSLIRRKFNNLPVTCVEIAYPGTFNRNSLSFTSTPSSENGCHRLPDRGIGLDFNTFKCYFRLL
jgi:hypothetical protein